MAWVVDSCILLDIALADPQFGIASAQCVAARFEDGIVACPSVRLRSPRNLAGSSVR